MTMTRVGYTPSDSEYSDDERRLYGDPQHEVGGGTDPERLYGKPQHEGRGPLNDLQRFWLDCLTFRKSLEKEIEFQ
jgi:hypothetical protein